MGPKNNTAANSAAYQTNTSAYIETVGTRKYLCTEPTAHTTAESTPNPTTDAASESTANPAAESTANPTTDAASESTANPTTESTANPTTDSATDPTTYSTTN